MEYFLPYKTSQEKTLINPWFGAFLGILATFHQRLCDFLLYFGWYWLGYNLCYYWIIKSNELMKFTLIPRFNAHGFTSCLHKMCKHCFIHFFVRHIHSSVEQSLANCLTCAKINKPVKNLYLGQFPKKRSWPYP